MAPEKRSAHKRYLVDKRFQIKYTLMIVLICSSLYAFFGYRLYQEARAKTAILQLQQPDVRKEVEAEDRTILYYLAGFFLLQVGSLLQRRNLRLRPLRKRAGGGDGGDRPGEDRQTVCHLHH